MVKQGNTPNITFVQGKTYKVVYEIENYVEWKYSNLEVSNWY